MKDKTILAIIGMVIFIVLTLVNRYVISVNEYVYIILSLLGILLLFIGTKESKQN